LSPLERYYKQALKLLPPGLIWAIDEGGRLARILKASAGQLAACHLRADGLMLESSPQTASETLPEWEEMAGLPDECVGGGVDGLAVVERQELVVERLTRRGSQAVNRYLELARALGYDVQIIEYRPFICGRSACGGPDQLGRADARLWWRVVIKSPRLHWFRAGRGRCGERLGWGSPAVDIECQMGRRKPAHTEIIFEYEEQA
jgi:uncharacterized protein YmfQ (DUF2313 family)